MPKTQTPSVLTTNTLTVTQAASTTTIVAIPTCETRARRKRPKEASQTFATPSSENSPPDLGDSHVNVVEASCLHAFFYHGWGSPSCDQQGQAVEGRSWGQADDAKIQEAYYQGQYDCTTTVKPEVQQNFQVYFTKGWIVVLDKLEVEAASSLRQERNVPILTKLVIIPNPEIQAIINDKSPIKKVERAGPTTTCGGEATTYAALSSTKEPHV
nr:hypothetical protein CFP56_75806 [Quercus suber]